MRSIFLLTVSVFITLITVAQKPSMDEQAFLSGGIRLPLAEVQNIVTGERFNLSELGAKQLKYVDKPAVVITWSDLYCQVCITRINNMLTEGLYKDFNIITINIDAPSSRSDEDLKKKISSRIDWSNITHLRMDAKTYEMVFEATSVPYWFILDSDQRIVNAYLSYDVKMKSLREELTAVASKPDFTSKVYLRSRYSDNLDIPAAYHLSPVSSADSYLQVEQLNRKATLRIFYTNDNKIHREISYKQTNDAWIYDGAQKDYFEGGILRSEAVYVDGKLNGVHKAYNKRGQVSTTKTYVNGKLDGPVTEYINGLEVRKTTYKAGEKVSVEILKENVAKLKAQLFDPVNKAISTTAFSATEEGMVHYYEGDSYKSVTLVKWEDISAINTDFDGLSFEGEGARYKTNASNRETSFSFKNETYYLEKEIGYKETHWVMFKGSEAVYDRVVGMLKMLRTLSTLK